MYPIDFIAGLWLWPGLEDASKVGLARRRARLRLSKGLLVCVRFISRSSQLLQIKELPCKIMHLPASTAGGISQPLSPSPSFSGSIYPESRPQPSLVGQTAYLYSSLVDSIAVYFRFYLSEVAPTATFLGRTATSWSTPTISIIDDPTIKRQGASGVRQLDRYLDAGVSNARPDMSPTGTVMSSA